MSVSNFKIRDIKVYNFEVEIHDFGYAKYMYPKFNMNAEFKVSKKGYKQLSHYVRNCKKYMGLCSVILAALSAL